MDVERQIAWALTRWSLGVQAGIVGLLASVFAATWLATRRRILRTWALAWACDALALVAVLALALWLEDSRPDVGFRLYVVYSGLKLLYAGFLVLGLHQYHRVPWAMRPDREAALLALVMVWSLGLAVAAPSVVGIQALTYLAVAAVLVPAGIAGLRRKGDAGGRVVATVFLVQGIVFLHHGAVLLPSFVGGAVPAYMSRISFFDAVIEFLVGLGCVMALGLRIVREVQDGNRRLEERERILRSMVETDPLTGLANRRALRSYAEDLGAPAMVFFLDIDRFKAINDAWGHATGDRCLLRVADALRAVFRSDDGLFRVGGDEFLAIVPELDPAAAADRARRLRESLESAGGGTPVSISIGIARLDERRRLDEAIAEADAAMYEDKARHR